jgi:hypothetical protein
LSLSALELDYRRPARRSLVARYALAAVALVFAVDAGTYYLALRRDVAARERDLARVAHRPAIRHIAPATVSSETLAFARETVGLLTTPWDRLFAALEAAQTERVALLSVEPDASQRTVTINGEAKDYLAAVSYVASLAGQKGLREVHLTRHELLRSGAQRPLAFSISAAWTEDEP